MTVNNSRSRRDSPLFPAPRHHCKIYHLAIMLAFAVIMAEQAAIIWIRSRDMNTPIFSAAMQVDRDGVRVFLTGLLIGGA